MNFAYMLMQDVKPQPPTRPKQELRRNTEPAVREKMEATVEKYKSVMGTWIKTSHIERRAGLARCSAYATLERYRAAGLIERRPAYGLPWNQRRGWEWRWIA